VIVKALLYKSQNLHIVSKDTTLGSVLGVLGKLVGPLNIGSRVVAAVHVVLVKDGLLVAARGANWLG
jgi:hypothetical protein